MHGYKKKIFDQCCVPIWIDMMKVLNWSINRICFVFVIDFVREKRQLKRIIIFSKNNGLLLFINKDIKVLK